MASKLNYDKAFEELQEIMAQIQSDQVSIEDISKLIKRAQELHKFCKERLRNIEEDIQNINVAD